MVDFSKRDEVKRWLDKIKPARRRREVAVALAARAALRVLPLVGRELARDKRNRDGILSTLVLPCLRAVASSWVEAKYPTHRAEPSASGFATDDDGFTSIAGGYAAANAGRAAAFAALANAPDAADAAAYAAADAAHDAFLTDDTYAADAADAAELINSNRSVAELAGMPLWRIGAPSWAIEAWRTLKSALLVANQDWEVWTDWYEARLAGDATRSPIEALEVARVTIPDEIWKQGPAIVNAEIKRLINEHERGEQVVDPATQNDANFAPILATRSALRVLPLLATDGRPSGSNKSIFVLSVFHALAVAWASVQYSPSVDRGRSVAAARDVDPYGPAKESAAYLVGDAAAQAAFAAGSVGPKVVLSRSTVARTRAKAAVIAMRRGDASEVIIEQTSFRDQTDIVPGVRPDQIAQIELWPGRDPPPFFGEQWETLKERLRLANEGWDVWIDWYEARLDGRLRSQMVELAYVEFVRAVPPTLSASKANSEIKRLIDLQSQELPIDAPPSKRPEIPRPKPAAVEPIFQGSRLTLPKKTADADMPGPTIFAALKALAQTLGELAEDAEEQSNIDKRFVARLQEIAKGVPTKRPNQIELFRLGHDYDELSAYSKTVANSWPELVAARYMAMTRAFERTLRRFPRWLDFTREPPIANISAQDAHDISRAVQALSAVLRAPESLNIVDPILPDALDRISAPLDLAAQRREARGDPIELGMELWARDVLESVNNTFKLVAALALAVKFGAAKGAEFAGKKLGSYATQFGSHADQSLLKSSAQLGDKVGPAIVKLAKWSMRATIGGAVLQSQGPPLAAWLVQHYPQMFSWLEPFATFLH